EHENLRQGPRSGASKQTRNFTLFEGESGKSENNAPGNNGQQEQRPREQQKPDQYWKPKDGRAAAHPSCSHRRVEKAPSQAPPSHPNQDDGGWRGKNNVRQGTEEVFRRRQFVPPLGLIAIRDSSIPGGIAPSGIVAAMPSWPVSTVSSSRVLP